MAELEMTTWGKQKLTQSQLEQIHDTLRMFSGLKRKELAATLCETLQWSSSQKRNKIFICFQLLAELEELGLIQFAA